MFLGERSTEAKETTMYPKKVKCPLCPASVVVYTEEEEAAVKRNGCGVRGCPGRE